MSYVSQNRLRLNYMCLLTLVKGRALWVRLVWLPVSCLWMSSRDNKSTNTGIMSGGSLRLDLRLVLLFANL